MIYNIIAPSNGNRDFSWGGKPARLGLIREDGWTPLALLWTTQTPVGQQSPKYVYWEHNRAGHIAIDGKIVPGSDEIKRWTIDNFSGKNGDNKYPQSDDNRKKVWGKFISYAQANGYWIELFQGIADKPPFNCIFSPPSPPPPDPRDKQIAVLNDQVAEHTREILRLNAEVTTLKKHLAERDKKIDSLESERRKKDLEADYRVKTIKDSLTAYIGEL